MLKVESLTLGIFKIQKDTDGLVHLSASIIGQDGVIRPDSHLDLAPLKECRRIIGVLFLIAVVLRHIMR